MAGRAVLSGSRSSPNAAGWADGQLELQARQLFDKNSVDQMRVIEANLRCEARASHCLPLTLSLIGRMLLKRSKSCANSLGTTFHGHVYSQIAYDDLFSALAIATLSSLPILLWT